MAGNGCTTTVVCAWPVGFSPTSYASHRPSGEKFDASGHADDIPLRGRDCFSGTENVQSENRCRGLFETTLYVNTSPWGNQDSGMCDVPDSGLVSRSAVPLKSERCQKMAESPSRSD